MSNARADEASGIETSDDTPIWERAVARALTEFAYGDVIPRAWLEERFEIVWPERMTKAEAQKIMFRFVGHMHAFTDRLLREHKMVLQSNHRGGWLIVQPSQQHIVALGVLRRGVERAVDRANAVIEHTRTDMLSPEQAQARRDAQARIGNFGLLTKQALDAGTDTGKSDQDQ